MEKKTLEISYKDIPNHYHEDEDGRVLQNDPTVLLVMIDHPQMYESVDDARFSMTKEEEDYYANPDNFDDRDYWGYTAEDYKKFDNEDYEDDDYTPYSRWSSYKIMHQYIRTRWIQQDNFILFTFSYIKKRIRLLASPINDTLIILRSEHARILSLFDETGPMADLAFHKTYSKAADIILNKVWPQKEYEDLPFGEHWTVEELRRTPQSHWCNDDVWSWDEFWSKASPLLVNYQKAKTYLIMIRFLQKYISLCEQDKEKGYKLIMQKSSNKYHQEAIDSYSSLQPPSYPYIPSIEHKGVLERLQQIKDLESVKECSAETHIGLTFSNFEEVFTNKKYVSIGVDVLLKNDGERIILDSNGKWLDTKKGYVSVLSAWLDAMEYHGMIEKGIHRKVLVPLLQNFFPELRLGAEARQFSDPTVKAYQHYRKVFTFLIVQMLH